jgi:hypothetical protein
MKTGAKMVMGIGWAALLFASLLMSAGAGFALRTRLSAAHRSPETRNLVELTTTMLLTFTALVLGLLTTSTKASFDLTDARFRTYAASLIHMDHLLVAYGPQTADARQWLKIYTAGVIATTWPNEPRPDNVAYPSGLFPSEHQGTIENTELGDLLNKIQDQIWALDGQNTSREALAADIRQQFDRLLLQRWQLIEEVGNRRPTPFYLVLTFWLAIVFVSFGLISGPNAISLGAIVLCALAIASVVFVITELNAPLDGSFAISSEPMRRAFAHM